MILNKNIKTIITLLDVYKHYLNYLKTHSDIDLQFYIDYYNVTSRECIHYFAFNLQDIDNKQDYEYLATQTTINTLKKYNQILLNVIKSLEKLNNETLNNL